MFSVRSPRLHQDYVELIGQFIASAPYTDDAAERALRARMKTALSAVGK